MFSAALGADFFNVVGGAIVVVVVGVGNGTNFPICFPLWRNQSSEMEKNYFECRFILTKINFALRNTKMREINSPKCTASLCGRGVKGSPRPRDRRWFQRSWRLKSKYKRFWLWPFALLGQTGRRAGKKEKRARWTTVISDFYTLLVMAVVYDPGKSSHHSHTQNGLLGRFWSLNKMGYVIVCNIGCCLASPWKELPCWWRWLFPAPPPSGSPHHLATILQ